MAYTLYYIKGACSMAVHVVLRELGETPILKRLIADAGEHKSPAYRRINPRATVPTVIDPSGRVMREAGAIIVSLCDAFESPLLQRHGASRAEVLEWQFFAHTQLHQTFGAYRTVRDAIQNDQAREEALAPIRHRLQFYWQDVERGLANRPYLAGSQCSCADITVTVMANWLQFLPQGSVVLGERTTDLLRRVVARPAYAEALQAEGVTYAMAA